MTSPDSSPTAQDAAHAVRLAVRWRKSLLAIAAGALGIAASAGAYQALTTHRLAAMEALGAKVADHDRQLQGIKQDVAIMRVDVGVMRADQAKAEAAIQQSKQEVLEEVRELRADLRALYNPRRLPLIEEDDGRERDRRTNTPRPRAPTPRP